MTDEANIYAYPQRPLPELLAELDRSAFLTAAQDHLDRIETELGDVENWFAGFCAAHTVLVSLAQNGFGDVPMSVVIDYFESESGSGSDVPEIQESWDMTLRTFRFLRNFKVIESMLFLSIYYHELNTDIRTDLQQAMNELTGSLGFDLSRVLDPDAFPDDEPGPSSATAEVPWLFGPPADNKYNLN